MKKLEATAAENLIHTVAADFLPGGGGGGGGGGAYTGGLSFQAKFGWFFQLGL